MLIDLKNNKAQIVSGEYVLGFFIVIAVVTGMTVFFQRAVQGRLYDARNYMVKEAQTRSGFTGNIYNEYEPYYIDRSSDITSDGNTSQHISGNSQVRNTNSTTDVTTTIKTAPPR
jgi:hypothetical protein